MIKVIHLLPYDGIGGAETAARSMADAPTPGMDFRLQYLFPDVESQGQRSATFNPFAFVTAVRRILAENPDLLVVSLWRSCIVGILVRLVRPRIRMVVIVHNSVDAHLGDALFTRLAMRMSRAVWADSEASVRMRFAKSPRAELVIVPFLVRRIEPLPDHIALAHASPCFVFWGRLAAQKNLLRSLDLFHRIWRARPDARFDVIGPDAGELGKLQAHCAGLGIDQAVHFLGPMDFDSIRRRTARHAFYLQTSNYEGMAMSVVEAMQLGLVPIVTPVGEVGSYCRAGHNAVVIEDDARALDDVLNLLGRPDAYRALRQNAIDTWQGKVLYRERVAAECRRLAARPTRSGVDRHTEH